MALISCRPYRNLQGFASYGEVQIKRMMASSQIWMPQGSMTMLQSLDTPHSKHHMPSHLKEQRATSLEPLYHRPGLTQQLRAVNTSLPVKLVMGARFCKPCSMQWTTHIAFKCAEAAGMTYIVLYDERWYASASKRIGLAWQDSAQRH